MLSLLSIGVISTSLLHCSSYIKNVIFVHLGTCTYLYYLYALNLILLSLYYSYLLYVFYNYHNISTKLVCITIIGL